MVQQFKALLFLKRTQGQFPHPHGASQPPIAPVSGDLIPASDLCGCQAHMWGTYVHLGKTFIYIYIYNK